MTQAKLIIINNNHLHTYHAQFMQFTIFVTSYYKNVCFLFVYDREYKTYVQVNKPLLKMYTLTIRWCFYDI